ncbi:MAG: oligosaccharide flippase family protein, partial [Bacteroidales bacterium]|nr:oligosaccharide flippase family protein [Bacteroidales bacterium]
MLNLKELFHNQNVRKFVSLLSTDVLVRGANFLLIPIFLYLMPMEEFGVYGYLYNFAITCSLIMNLGYHSALPKMYSETKENKVANSSMLFTLSTTLFGFVASLFLIFYLTDLDYAFFNIVNRNQNTLFDYKGYRPYLFIALTSMIFSNFLTYYFISAKKIRSIQSFNLIRLFICNLTVILVLYFSKDSDTALIRLSVTYVIELALCLIFSRQIIKEFICKYSIPFIKKALKIGLPICFVALINSFINFGDKQFVMMYCGSQAMGGYNLATMLATIPLIVFQSFNFIWLPDFLDEKNLITLNRKTNKNSKIIVLLLLFISLVVWTGTYILIEFGVFPAEY